MSLFVIHKILRVFVNTLTVEDKQYLLNRDNLTQLIQIQLSQKEKAFSEFFFAFLKPILNFKNLRKKDNSHSLCISGKTGSLVFERTLSHITWQMGRNNVGI